MTFLVATVPFPHLGLVLAESADLATESASAVCASAACAAASLLASFLAQAPQPRKTSALQAGSMRAVGADASVQGLATALSSQPVFEEEVLAPSARAALRSMA